MSVVSVARRRLVEPSTGHYVSLTAVRGLASLAVVATHAAFATGHYSTPTWGLVLARLDFGVALFFVLSGFLLFRKWVAALANVGAAPGLRRYAVSRARRILPAYWVAVLLGFWLVPTTVGRGPAALVEHLTLTQMFTDTGQRRGLTQMWSLSVEAAFYVVLPLLALVIVGTAGGRWRPRRLLLGIALLGAVTVAWYVWTRLGVVLPIQSIYWLPGFLDWFAVGMALAVLAVHRERGGDLRWFSWLGESVGSAWVIAASLLVIASTPLAGPATVVPLGLSQVLAKNLLYAVAAFLLVAPLVVGGEKGGMTGWLRWGPAQWLGGISYEIFVLHLIVMQGVLALLGGAEFTGDIVAVLVLTLAVTVPAAWLLERLLSRVTRHRAL